MELPKSTSRRNVLRLLGAGVFVPNILIPRHVLAEDTRVLRSLRAQPPSIVGKSAIVIDPHARKVLFAKNADTRRPVASTQKLLTALLTVERGDLSGMVTVAKTDTQVEPTKLYIAAGQRYRRSALVEALLVKSGNDVARCLARDYAGGQEAFAKAMNARARKLGMRNSNFVTSNGLPAAGQHSTARDMGILALASYNDRTIRSFIKEKVIDFRYSDGRVVALSNTNKLLSRSPYCNGMKTGYTNASGKCLISSGAHGNKAAIVVILGGASANIWADSQKLLHWGLGIG